jgi:hypothetical protein
MGEFLNISFASFVLTVVRSAAALVLLWLVLRALDRAVGFSFRSWIGRVSGADTEAGADGEERASNGEPMALAVYLGARFVGACILFGLLFS